MLTRIAEAKLFWHMRGLASVEENPVPEQMEAMMTGCVLIVLPCGGLPEIVDHEVSGSPCRDADAVVRHSAHLANDECVCLSGEQIGGREEHDICAGGLRPTRQPASGGSVEGVERRPSGECESS
jgi:hypothetical protein